MCGGKECDRPPTSRHTTTPHHHSNNLRGSGLESLPTVEALPVMAKDTADKAEADKGECSAVGDVGGSMHGLTSDLID